MSAMVALKHEPDDAARGASDPANAGGPAEGASPGDWITAESAAPLLGLSARHVRRVAAGDWSRRGVARMAPPPAGGKPVWWLHRSIDNRLSKVRTRISRESLARESLMQRFSQHLVERAYKKAHWVRQWRRGCVSSTDKGSVVADRIVAEAKSVEGHGFRISVRSLAAWHQARCALGPDGHIVGVEALVDRYRGPMAADRSVADDGSVVLSRSIDAIDRFYAMYHCQNRLSIKECHEATLAKARVHGWSWPGSVRATSKWLDENDDRSLTLLFRQGPEAWCHRFMPSLEMDWSLVAPGEFYVADHAQCDFWVSHRGQQIRPWLTAIQDCGSRSIVGWHIGASPQQDAILSSLRMAFRDWAIPTTMRIDNGKDFCSKLLTGDTKKERREREALKRAHGADWEKVDRRAADLTECDDPRWLGIIPELGIELTYAIPYAPWSKGTLERWFATMHDQCGKTFATYCGRSVLTRPECLNEIRSGHSRAQRRRLKKLHGRSWAKHVVLKMVDESDVPTLDEARRRVGHFILAYHLTGHRGNGMNGRSPQTVWNTAAGLRRAVADDLMFLMDIRGKYRVGGNGVRLTVGAASLGYGATCAALSRWKGRKVLVKLDANDVSVAWAICPKTRKLIGRMEANQRIHPNSSADDVREAIAESMRDRAVMHKASRTAARRTRTATQYINQHHRDRLAELQATGTDAADSAPNVIPVPTGFEQASMAARTAVEPPPPDEYANIRMDDLDLSSHDLDLSSHEDEPPSCDEGGEIDLTLGDDSHDDDGYGHINLDDLKIDDN